MHSQRPALTPRGPGLQGSGRGLGGGKSLRRISLLPQGSHSTIEGRVCKGARTWRAPSIANPASPGLARIWCPRPLGGARDDGTLHTKDN